MDSRTVKALLKELAASPREISSVDIDPKTDKLTRIVFADRQGVQSGLVPSTSPGSIPGFGSVKDAEPKTAKPPRKSAVVSLKLAPPIWQHEEPESSIG